MTEPTTTTPATYFATKYDSAAAEVVAILADPNEGYGYEATGDVEAPTGYFALVILDDTCDLDFSDTAGAYPRGDFAGETARTYGVTPDDVTGVHIVTHDSQGFVSVETFATEEEARAEFDCRSHRFDVWSADDRDDDGESTLTDADGVYVCPVPGHGYHSI